MVNWANASYVWRQSSGRSSNLLRHNLTYQQMQVECAVLQLVHCWKVGLCLSRLELLPEDSLETLLPSNNEGGDSHGLAS